MGSLSIDMPAGGTAGDVYLLHVKSEVTSSPVVTVAGFTALASSGKAQSWDRSLWRAYDGSEPASVEIRGLGTNFAQAQIFLLRGCGVVPFVAGSAGHFAGSPADVPYVPVSASTTTIDNTLVLLGANTWQWYPAYAVDGISVSAGTVDARVLSQDHGAVSVFAVEKAVAGTVGPWTLWRDLELGTEAVGGSWWTVLVQPNASDPTPTVEEITTVADFAIDTGPDSMTAGTPERVTITNPHNSTETAVIGGSTVEEQAALEADQYARWDLVYALTQGYDDALVVLRDNLSAYTAANEAFISSPGSSDPQLVALTAQVQLLLVLVSGLTG